MIFSLARSLFLFFSFSLFLFSFSSCSFLSSFSLFSSNSPSSYVKEHGKFLERAKKAKEGMNRKNYKKWLMRKIAEKESYLGALTSEQEREERIYGQHEMASSSSLTTSAGPQNSDFMLRSSAQKMRGYKEKGDYIKKEIFYLKSQLSALEN